MSLVEEMVWVYVGAMLRHKATHTKYKVVSQNKDGWWLENQWDMKPDWYSRWEVFQFFEPAPIKTRFERISEQ